MQLLRIILLSMVTISATAYSECLVVESNTLAEPFNAVAITKKMTLTDASLRKALVAFDKALIANGPKVRESWHAYLKWNVWAQPFLDTKILDLRSMKRVASLFYNVGPGFDHATILALRIALVHFIDFNEATAGMNMSAIGDKFQLNIIQLERLLSLDTCNYPEIDEIVAWLVVTNQSPSLVSTLKASFSSPSIVLNTDRAVIDDALNKFKKTKTETKSSGNSIQGAWVVGQSTVNAHTSASVESSHNARIRIDIEGTVTSPNNVATKGPVTVLSSALTNWTAFAEIFWDGNKIGYTAPQVDAKTRSRIKSVDGPIIIRRIGARKAAEAKPAGEAQGARIIEGQIGDEMKLELSQAVKNLEEKSSDIMGLMRKTGMLPLPANTSLSGNSLQIGLFPHSTSGIGAGVFKSSVMNEEGTFTLSAHENAIGKLVKHTLGGSRWDDLMFAHLQKELTGTNTDEFMIGLTKERWSAEWDWNHPVQVRFTDDGMAFIFRYSSITIDDVEFTVPYEIQATFGISASSLGMEFKRVSEITVKAVNAGDHVNPEVESFVMRKFHGLFDDVFYLDGIHFPKGGDLDDLSSMVLKSVKTENHWIHMKVSAPALGKPSE